MADKQFPKKNLNYYCFSSNGELQNRQQQKTTQFVDADRLEWISFLSSFLSSFLRKLLIRRSEGRWTANGAKMVRDE